MEISKEKEVLQMIDYSPLWKTMERKGITQYKLIERGVDRRVLDALRKNRNITLLTVEKICKALDCEPNDIIKFMPDNIGVCNVYPGGVDTNFR